MNIYQAEQQPISDLLIQRTCLEDVQRKYSQALDRFKDKQESLLAELTATKEELYSAHSKISQLNLELLSREEQIHILEEKLEFSSDKNSEVGVLKEEIRRLQSSRDSSASNSEHILKLEREKEELMKQHTEQLKSQEEFIQAITNELSMISKENSELRAQLELSDEDSSDKKALLNPYDPFNAIDAYSSILSENVRSSPLKTASPADNRTPEQPQKRSQAKKPPILKPVLRSRATKKETTNLKKGF